MYIHACMYTYIHTYILTCIHRHTCMWTHSSDIHIHTALLSTKSKLPPGPQTHVYTHTTNTHIHACIYTHACIHTNTQLIHKQTYTQPKHNNEHAHTYNVQHEHTQHIHTNTQPYHLPKHPKVNCLQVPGPMFFGVCFLIKIITFGPIWKASTLKNFPSRIALQGQSTLLSVTFSM